MGVFDKFHDEMYPYQFSGSLHIGIIAGGTPTNPKVAESWLKSKLGDKDDLIREMVAQTMVDRGVTVDEAVKAVDNLKSLNGFKRDEKKGLFIEGRHLKAALKEAASVAVDSGKVKPRGWGKVNSKKGLLSYLAEHVFVVEDRLYLGAMEPTDVMQRFINTFRGSAIQYEEYVEDANIDFTVITDHDFTEKEWAAIWTSGELQGIGASRSQGYGRYEVTRWEAIDLKKPRSKRG